MEIEVETKSVKKVKIDLPYYTKTVDQLYFYKVYSEDHCIQVCLTPNNIITPEVRITYSSMAFSGNLVSAQCTKEVFDAAFDKAINEINKYK